MRIGFLLLLLPALCLAEPATAIRATELRSAAASDAAVVAPLAEGAKVDTLERKGGWTRVRAQGGAEGWVRMLALRQAGGGAAQQGDSGIAQLLNVARSGTSGTQVTTGVRGLDAEQLANARPNAAELQKMQGYAASKDAAAGFAASGKLQSRSVGYPGEGG
jgi:SH3 domain-containing protein